MVLPSLHPCAALQELRKKKRAGPGMINESQTVGQITTHVHNYEPGQGKAQGKVRVQISRARHRQGCMQHSRGRHCRQGPELKCMSQAKRRETPSTASPCFFPHSSFQKIRRPIQPQRWPWAMAGSQIHQKSEQGGCRDCYSLSVSWCTTAPEGIPLFLTALLLRKPGSLEIRGIRHHGPAYETQGRKQWRHWKWRDTLNFCKL